MMDKQRQRQRSFLELPGRLFVQKAQIVEVVLPEMDGYRTWIRRGYASVVVDVPAIRVHGERQYYLLLPQVDHSFEVGRCLLLVHNVAEEAPYDTPSPNTHRPRTLRAFAFEQEPGARTPWGPFIGIHYDWLEDVTRRRTNGYTDPLVHYDLTGEIVRYERFVEARAAQTLARLEANAAVVPE